MERRTRAAGGAPDDSLHPPSWLRYAGETHFSGDSPPLRHTSEAKPQPPSLPRRAGQCVPRDHQPQAQRDPMELPLAAYNIASLLKPHVKLPSATDLDVSLVSHLLQPFLSARTLLATLSTPPSITEPSLKPVGTTKKGLSDSVAPIVSKQARQSSPSPSHEPSKQGTPQPAPQPTAQPHQALLQPLAEPQLELKTTSWYILGVLSPALLVIPTIPAALPAPLLSCTPPPADHLALQHIMTQFLPVQHPGQRAGPKVFASFILGTSQQYDCPASSGCLREPFFRKISQEVSPASATARSSTQPVVVSLETDGGLGNNTEISTQCDRMLAPRTAREQHSTRLLPAIPGATQSSNPSRSNTKTEPAGRSADWESAGQGSQRTAQGDSTESAKTQEEAEPMTTPYYESYLMTSEHECPSGFSEELQDTMFFMEPKFHGFVFTLLHCVSQALANIFIKRLVVVPKAQMAFFACFGIMAGGMPGTFSANAPFGPRKAQPLLLVRAIFGVVLLMSKGMALTYLTVADVAIIFALIPVAASLGSWLYLREKVHRLQGLSIATGFVGVLMAMRPAVVFAETGIETAQLTGIMYALCCVISMSALIIVIRYMRDLTHKSLTFNNGCMRVAVAMVAAFVGGSFDRLLSGAFLGSLLLMGKINFCALFFLSKALELESAVVVSTVKLCGDITMSVIFQAIFLDVYPDVWTFFGGLFVIASALIVTIDKFVHTRSHGLPFAIYNWSPFLLLRRICNRFSPEEVEHF